MARVPQYQRQVAPTVTPDVPISDHGVTAQDFGGGIAQTIGQIGKQVAGFALDQQEEANKTRLMEFENTIIQRRQELIDNPQTGIHARQGRDAIGLGTTVLPQWEKSASKLVNELPPRLRGSAKSIADGQTAHIRQSLMTWEVQQSDELHKREAESGIELSQNDAVAGRYDPGAVNKAVDRALFYATEGLKRQGAGEQTMVLTRLKVASGIQRSVIESLALEDPGAAEDRLIKLRPQLTAEDQAAIEGKLRPTIDDQGGYAIAQQIDAGIVPQVHAEGFDGPATKVQPSTTLPTLPLERRRSLPFDAPELDGYAAAVEQRMGLPAGLINAIKNAGEKSGSGAVSPAGARGVMQFMPSMLQAYAVSDPSDPVQMIDAAGRYLRDHLKRYGGNVEAVIAHYNGGNAAGEAVAGGKQPPAKETRSYLARVKQALGGQVPATIDPEALARARESDDPEALVALIPRSLPLGQRRAAESYLRHMASSRKAATQAREQAAAMGIYDKVTAAPPTAPLSKVLTPDDMATMGRNAALSASIGRYRELVSSGSLVRDDARTVEQIEWMKVAKPDEFKALPLAEYADRLSGKTLRALLKDQVEIAKPGKHAQFATEAELLGIEFNRLGIANDPDTEGVNEPAIARGQYREAYFLQKEAFMQKNGRAPDAQEIRALLKELTLTSARTRGTYAGGSNAEDVALADRPVFQRLAAAPEVPPDYRPMIVQALQAAGIANPTELQIRGAYAESQAGGSK